MEPLAAGFIGSGLDCRDRRRLRSAHHLVSPSSALPMPFESTCLQRLPSPTATPPLPSPPVAAPHSFPYLTKAGRLSVTSNSLEEQTSSADWPFHLPPPLPPLFGSPVSWHPSILFRKDNQPRYRLRGEIKCMCQGRATPSMIACTGTTPSPFTILSKASATVLPRPLQQQPHKDSTADVGERTIRARLQRLLIQFLLLPVVWMSLCCVITAAMGIECVETIRKVLAPPPSDGREDLNNRPTKKAKRDVKKIENHSQKDQCIGRLHPREQDDEDGNEELRHVNKKKSKPTNDDSDEADSQRLLLRSSSLVVANTTRTCRPKKRRVLIWDLDETLVLFASLYSGQFARANAKDVAASVALGEQMMTYLVAVLERHFYFSELHDADIDHIASLAPRTAEAEANMSGQIPKDSPLYSHVVADRYQRIRAIYERQDAVDFLDDHGSQWCAARQGLVASIDGFSTGWIKEAREILALTTTKHLRSRPAQDQEQDQEDVEIINVMVTNTQLSPALCKCLIYGLDAFFPIDCVYSSSKLHKMRCFQTIIAKYSNKTAVVGTDGDKAVDVEFIAIGDGAEEEQVSQALGLSFFKVRSLEDLKQLRYELQLVEKPSVVQAQENNTPAQKQPVVKPSSPRTTPPASSTAKTQ